MPRDIETEQEIDLTPKRGRPKKLDEDVIFGHDIDSDEEKRLREENEISTILEREDATTSTIIVNRRMNRTERYAHLAEIGLKDYNREEIARQYGGGEYRCRIRRSDGSFGPTWYFSVDKTRKSEMDSEGSGTAGGYDAVRLVETVASKLSEKQGGPDMNSIVNMMSDKSDKMMQMMIMNQQESTKMMVGMMSAMASAMAGRPQPTNDTALTSISTMLLKHSLESSKTSMDDMLGTIIKLKKLAGEDEDDSEPEKGSFVQDIVGAIPQLMRTMFPGGQQAQPLPEQAPVQAPTPQTAQTPPPASKELTPQEKMESIIPALIQFAEQKSDVGEVHDFYQQLITDEEYEAVATYLENPGWWENISKPIPQMLPHKEWFFALRAIILEEVPEETPDESTAQPIVGVAPRVTPKEVKPKAPKNGKH
ncbi:hypothetical protein EBR66_08390 [bacterium]|nr:hypothetical protein [bacterium]